MPWLKMRKSGTVIEVAPELWLNIQRNKTISNRYSRVFNKYDLELFIKTDDLSLEIDLQHSNLLTATKTSSKKMAIQTTTKALKILFLS